MTARLEIVAKPGARSVGIYRRGADIVVSVRQRAQDGQANAAIVRAVAGWLHIPPSRVRLVYGATARRKLVAVEDLDDETLRRRVDELAEG